MIPHCCCPAAISVQYSQVLTMARTIILAVCALTLLMAVQQVSAGVFPAAACKPIERPDQLINDSIPAQIAALSHRCCQGPALDKSCLIDGVSYSIAVSRRCNAHNWRGVGPDLDVTRVRCSQVALAS